MADTDREELEAVIACLGDDAAQLREENPEDERADNMDRAATLLGDMNTRYAELLAAYHEACVDAAKGCASWQPIETVPKDGREVILREGGRVGAACWVKWPDTYDNDGAPNADGGEGWTVGYDGDEWRAPTHWQAMPSASGVGEVDRG